MLSSLFKARADTLPREAKQWKFSIRQLWLLRQEWQILKMILPQKNGHRIKTPSSKLMILVSYYWENNFIRIFFSVPRFLGIIDRRCCVLSGPPCIIGYVYVPNISMMNVWTSQSLPRQLIDQFKYCHSTMASIQLHFTLCICLSIYLSFIHSFFLSFFRLSFVSVSLIFAVKHIRQNTCEANIVRNTFPTPTLYPTIIISHSNSVMKLNEFWWSFLLFDPDLKHWGQHCS